MELTVKLNNPNAVSCHPDDGTVLIRSGDTVVILEFATPRHALDLIGSIADAQGWMIDAQERELAAELQPITTRVRRLA